jgi:hypothetical protein
VIGGECHVIVKWQKMDGEEGEPAETVTREARYNLLEEEDPDDFVSIDIPEDISASDIILLPPSDPRREGLLRRLRLSSRLSNRRQRGNMAGSGDVSQLPGEDDAVDLRAVEADRSRAAAEVDRLVSFEASEASLSSDMLMSMNTTLGGGVDMSLRQPAGSYGASAPDLQLPSDKELAKRAQRVRLDSMDSETQREFEDEDVESATWAQHQKHVFILSLSGKPIYSRYGKEDRLVSLFGVMQALVSIVQDDKDNLRSVVAGKHRFVFVCRGPLVLVAVTKLKLSESQLALQLKYTYNQILSVLTNTQLQQIFDSNPGFDLRYLLQGSEKFIDSILNMMDSDPSFVLAGTRCLAMPVPYRQTISGILSQCRTKDILFIVLVAEGMLVTYATPKEHTLTAMDIHLILNLVHASTSFRSAESWTPICLPKFNDTGFLHAHVSYLPRDSPACLLLISTDKEKFFALQEVQKRIVEKLEKHNCIDVIKQAVKDSPYTIDHLHAPEIRHFVYRSRKTACITSPKIPVVYSDKEDRDRLMELYMTMHQRLHTTLSSVKILYHIGAKEALLGWRTAGFELYMVFDPLIAKSQAILLGNKLIRWISKEEERLIITSYNTF